MREDRPKTLEEELGFNEEGSIAPLDAARSSEGRQPTTSLQ